MGLVGGIIMIFKYRAMSKTKQLAAADFGMGTADEKPLVWKRVRDGFIIASLTTIYLFTLLDVVCKVFGINYQFFCVFAQLNRLTPERFLLSLPYIVLGIILLVVINISIATSRRIKDSGNETKDIIKTILINIFLSAGPLTLLLAIQFIACIRLSPDGIAPLSMNLFTGLAYALGFPVHDVQQRRHKRLPVQKNRQHLDGRIYLHLCPYLPYLQLRPDNRIISSAAFYMAA